MIATDENLFKGYRIQKNILGKYGIIRADSHEVVIEYVFDEIRWLTNYDYGAVACLKLGDKWGYVPYKQLKTIKQYTPQI